MYLFIVATMVMAGAEPKPFFDGQSLAGWVNVNCAPNTFRVENGEIITSGVPTGFLRTDKQYENFVLSFEWMHTNTKEPGNSGLFVWGDALPAVGTGYTRGIEVQVLVNLEKEDYYTSHGDLFSIWGATCTPARPHPQGWARCLPSERRCKGGGEWNQYEITGNDGVLTLAVNGKVVSEVRDCSPRKGYLALESEGAECRFRNFKFRELPSTNPKPEEVATLDEGFVSLYTGVDLTGWTDEAKGWRAGETLVSRAAGKLLRSAKPIGPGVLIVDVKPPMDQPSVTVMVDGGVLVELPPSEAGKWRRHTIPISNSGTLVMAANPKTEVRNLFFQPKK